MRKYVALAAFAVLLIGAPLKVCLAAERPVHCMDMSGSGCTMICCGDLGATIGVQADSTTVPQPETVAVSHLPILRVPVAISHEPLRLRSYPSRASPKQALLSTYLI